MLSDANPAVVGRMLSLNCCLGVIGRNQKTSDLPPHAYLKSMKTSDGREIDAGTRGLGGTPSIPASTFGEENLDLCDPFYPLESILVHEFGHAVMNCGFDDLQKHLIDIAYADALKAGYDPKLYMFSNPEELWANGTQAWFHAIDRTDVNAGIKTRAGLQENLPQLASLMQQVYGDGEWRYPDSCACSWSR